MAASFKVLFLVDSNDETRMDTAHTYEEYELVENKDRRIPDRRINLNNRNIVRFWIGCSARELYLLVAGLRHRNSYTA